MNPWLDTVAYRTDVNVMTLALAWLTISYQSAKSALKDLVQRLRSE